MKGKNPGFPQNAGSVLRDVLNRMGLGVPLSRHNLVRLWPKIVDSTVASHARVEQISGSTLVLAVDSSVWMNELSAIKILLLQKVNARLEPEAPPITEIRFVQRSWAKRRETRETTTKPPPMTPQEAEILESVLAPVTDPDLKAIFARILEKDRKLKWRRCGEPAEHDKQSAP
jgi:hypothetical protein